MKKIASILLFFCTTLVFSQPAGSLDSSFGNGGIVILDDYSISGDLVIQTDGKILVAGRLNSYIKLWRLNPNGTIDENFISPTTSVFNSVANMSVQSDGKIVVAGTQTILRFNSDGSLDTNFGEDGVVNASLYITAMKLDVLSDKIIVGGIHQTQTPHSFVIARYNSDGTPDTTFNGSGMKVFPPNSSSATINDIHIDSSHKISAAGYYRFQTNYLDGYATNNWLCRVNEDGTMDTTFSDDGIVVVDIGSFYSEKFNQSNAILMKEDGSLLISGTKGASPFFARDFSLYEISPTGTLSASNMPLSYGFVTNQNDIANTMAVDNSGKYVLAGKTGNGVFQNSFALLRLNSDYTVDTTFGDNGRVTTFSQSYNNRIENMAIQTDNKIVVVGTVIMGNDVSFTDKICIARYIGTTTLDVNQFENDNQLQIFPNPATKILYVSIPNDTNPNDFYTITDLNGRIILTGLIRSKNLEINVEGLENGLYILTTSQSLKPTKFIKN